MSYLLKAFEKVTDKMEAAKAASAFNKLDAVLTATDELMKLLNMTVQRIDATDERIDQAIKDAEQSIDELQAVVCKLSKRIAALDPKELQTAQ